MNANASGRTRVLVVDDAVVIRRIVSEVVSADDELELAGWASNGKIALAKIPQVNPDCITMDVEMPEMDGIETLKQIRKLYKNLPVIMFSTLTNRGAAKTMEALANGATDYVAKPANVGSVSECMDRLRDDLIPKIKAYARFERRRKIPGSAAVPPPVPAKRVTAAVTPGILCIASSTGGPQALTELIPALPADFGVPVVVVQHMPPLFTALFAKRLDELSMLRVCEGAHGQALLPGHVYIAPGGQHMEVHLESGATTLKLTIDPPENSCRPAADVLFRSVARVYGSAALGVVLTGMGHDGCRGSGDLCDAGARVFAQDQHSSVVWGMPGSVVEAGLAEQVLPLAALAGAITTRVAKRTSVMPHAR